MNLDQAINYIHSLYRPGNKPGLHRIRELLGLLGNPERALKFVHIAGTNGKGSTAAMTASILCKAGCKAGLFTSPYIYRFHERIQMDGKQISDEKLLPLILKVKALADTMAEPPTEFEFVTALAMEYYRQEACPIVVLEVGMGGLLDATNAIGVPEVAVITNIGLDHTEALGNTVEEIALNKAGIFKEGGEAVAYRCGASVDAVYEKVCRERNVRLTKADFESLRLISRDLTGQVFDCGSRKALQIPLLGEHQLHNASVVLSVADTLIRKGWNITETHIREGLRDVSWPGRFDIIHKDPLFILDGGHNPQCFETLVKNIEDYLTHRKVICLTGVLADKDYADMYRPLIPLVEEFVCVTPPNPRKLEAAELAKHLSEHGAKATACEAMEEGVRLSREKAGKDGVVLSFGSLYLLGAVREALDAVLAAENGKHTEKGETIMHIHHDHIAGGDHSHSHEHTHTHEHTHDGVTHSHEHCHAHEHGHTHPHEHDHLHGEGHTHDHSHECSCDCNTCGGCGGHTPMEELTALMQYMANHNAAHARELAELAVQLKNAGNTPAYEQVMAAVSDFEKGNLRLTAVLASLK